MEKGMKSMWKRCGIHGKEYGIYVESVESL